MDTLAMIERYYADPALRSPEPHGWKLNGIPVELPLSNPRGSKKQAFNWQRRVLEDIIPDSVNADAPERTPFRILWALTTNIQHAKLSDVFKRPDLEHLKPIFYPRSSANRPLPIAFHLLAVRAFDGDPDSRGFCESTFLLLCRDKEGRLDEPLIKRLVEAFRLPFDRLDLAQRTILEAISPGWTPDQDPSYQRPDAADRTEIPLDPSAGELFRRDLTTLLDARLPPSDFFVSLNHLLMIHLGLYQPRMAAFLNPRMQILLRDVADPDPANLEALQVLDDQPIHPFTGSLSFRAPRTDPLGSADPARRSFDEMDDSLVRFHFNIQLLIQIRRVARCWLTQEWSAARDMVVQREIQLAIQTPLQIVQRLHENPDFRTFFNEAMAAFSARFICTHLRSAPPTNRDDLPFLHGADSPLDALRLLYERFNRASVKSAHMSRANRQGIEISKRLLLHGEFGLIQGRGRVGFHLQIGSGLLPLLLLCIIGNRREKVSVREFWTRLESYGISLPPDERERLLQRLKSMGLYERYADAGEAAYICNLITGAQA